MKNAKEFSCRYTLICDISKEFSCRYALICNISKKSAKDAKSKFGYLPIVNSIPVRDRKSFIHLYNKMEADGL